MQAKDYIILALDVSELDQVRELFYTLFPYVSCFKVGLELMTSVGGPQIVEFVHSWGGQVFYDGKFGDIPNTVGLVARNVSKQQVKYFDLYASAGIGVMKAAVQEKRESLLLAVTVLTSLSESEVVSIFGAGRQEKFKEFAAATWAGCDGIICSSQELQVLGRNKAFEQMLKITPGIRPEWAAKNDQKNIMTPAQAVQAGASALVIGRPIIEAPAKIGSPVEAAKRILDEILKVI